MVYLLLPPVALLVEEPLLLLPTEDEDPDETLLLPDETLLPLLILGELLGLVLIELDLGTLDGALYVPEELLLTELLL